MGGMSVNILQMKERINRILGDEPLRRVVEERFSNAFNAFGASLPQARDMANRVTTMLLEGKSLLHAERGIHKMMHSQPVNIDGEEMEMSERIEEALLQRLVTIEDKINGELSSNDSRLLDYGGGDGRLAQCIYDTQAANGSSIDITTLDIDGAELAEGVKNTSLVTYDGTVSSLADLSHKTALSVCVLHHIENNEGAIKEIDRLTTDRLVLLETVPDSKSQDDMDLTFMADYFSNRLVRGNEYVPVPGVFDTGQGWSDRFAKHGWESVKSQPLGKEHDNIPASHHLLVMERAEGHSR